MHAVVVGATGLIGSYLVNQLASDPAFESIRLLVRHWNGEEHPKVEVVTVDFDDKSDLAHKTGIGDVLFVSVGTTRKKVQGDLQAYRKVDYDIPVTMAEIGARNGFKKFVLVSAVGADSRSDNYYLRFKGEVEDTVSKLGYDAVHIFRPSLLRGPRKETRVGEQIGNLLGPLVGLFLWGSFSKYKAIRGADVAAAMKEAAKTNNLHGVHIYHYNEMQKLASRGIGI